MLEEISDGLRDAGRLMQRAGPTRVPQALSAPARSLPARARSPGERPAREGEREREREQPAKAEGASGAGRELAGDVYDVMIIM